MHRFDLDVKRVEVKNRAGNKSSQCNIFLVVLLRTGPF